MSPNPILLASSDARPRYLEDILTVVATPRHGVFQFRYDGEYVSNDVHALFGSGELVGKKALVAFVGDASSDSYLVPVRFATIVDVKKVADALVFRLSADGFVDLRDWPHEEASLIAKGRKVVRSMTAGSKRYFAVSVRHDGLAATETKSGTTDWSQVVQRLAVLPAFISSYFVRTSFSTTRGGQVAEVSLSSDGVLSMRRDPVVLSCWFYCTQFHGDKREITVACDNEIVFPSSDSRYQILSRYDDVEFWLSPRSSNEDRRTLVHLLLPGDSATAGDHTTTVRVPVVVKRPRAERAIRAIMGGAGAALVAMPAILGPGSDVSLRLGLAAAGALLVAWVSAGYKPKK